MSSESRVSASETISLFCARSTLGHSILLNPHTPFHIIFRNSNTFILQSSKTRGKEEISEPKGEGGGTQK